MSLLDQLWDTVKGIAPTVIGGVAGTFTANPIVGGLVGNAVRKVLGKPESSIPVTEEEAARVIQDPKLYVEFKMIMGQHEVEKLKEHTKQIEAVNKTMQTEVVSGKGWKAGWRPFNGYLFGGTLFIDYVGSQMFLALLKIWDVTYTWGHIPEGVYYLWLALLGITSASRGVEKINKTKKFGDFFTGAIGM